MQSHAIDAASVTTNEYVCCSQPVSDWRVTVFNSLNCSVTVNVAVALLPRIQRVDIDPNGSEPVDGDEAMRVATGDAFESQFHITSFQQLTGPVRIIPTITPAGCFANAVTWSPGDAPTESVAHMCTRPGEYSICYEVISAGESQVLYAERSACRRVLVGEAELCAVCGEKARNVCGVVGVGAGRTAVCACDEGWACVGGGCAALAAAKDCRPTCAGYPCPPETQLAAGRTCGSAGGCGADECCEARAGPAAAPAEPGLPRWLLVASLSLPFLCCCCMALVAVRYLLGAQRAGNPLLVSPARRNGAFCMDDLPFDQGGSPTSPPSTSSPTRPVSRVYDARPSQLDPFLLARAHAASALTANSMSRSFGVSQRSNPSSALGSTASHQVPHLVAQSDLVRGLSGGTEVVGTQSPRNSHDVPRRPRSCSASPPLTSPLGNLRTAARCRLATMFTGMRAGNVSPTSPQSPLSPHTPINPLPPMATSPPTFRHRGFTDDVQENDLGATMTSVTVDSDTQNSEPLASSLKLAHGHLKKSVSICVDKAANVQDVGHSLLESPTSLRGKRRNSNVSFCDPPNGSTGQPPNFSLLSIQMSGHASDASSACSAGILKQQSPPGRRPSPQPGVLRSSSQSNNTAHPSSLKNLPRLSPNFYGTDSAPPTAR
eukprot:gene8596-13294_t